MKKVVLFTLFLVVTISLFAVIDSTVVLGSVEIVPEDIETVPWFITYQGLIGSFIGSFFAAVIALKSIKTTNKNNLVVQQNEFKRIKDNEISLHVGILNALGKSLKINKIHGKEISKFVSGLLELTANKFDDEDNLLCYL